MIKRPYLTGISILADFFQHCDYYTCFLIHCSKKYDINLVKTWNNLSLVFYIANMNFSA